MLLSQQIVCHTVSKISFSQCQQPRVDLTDISSRANDRFWLQNPLLWYSGTHLFLCLVFSRSDEKYYKMKYISGAQLVMRRDATFARGPACDEHPRMPWKENSKVRSEKETLVLTGPPPPQHEKGGSGSLLLKGQKHHLFSLSDLHIRVGAGKQTYSHSELLLKKRKANCKGAPKQKRELINYTTK